MRKAHVDPFLICTAALSAQSSFTLCAQVKRQAHSQILACKNSLLLVHTNKESISTTALQL